MSLMEAQKLCKTYSASRHAEVQALDRVSLQIPAETVTGLAGPSGSGKTTLLSLLGALDRATSGKVLLEGRDLGQCTDTEMARLRRGVGYVFQDFALIRGLTVRENVTYPLIPRGIGRDERQSLADEVLQQFGVAHCADKRPHQLSGGEQQRVALARAFATRPPILLADEPTSNLDAGSARQIAEWIRESPGRGVTVVLATHDENLLSLCSTIYHLENGKLERVESNDVA